jgi:amino acid adenylation domain-containing protein
MTFEPSVAAASTLPDVLATRAHREPHRSAFLYLDARGDPVASMTYAALDRAARRVAAGLVNAGGHRRPAVVALPTGPEFVAALFGSLYAGLPVVPAYPVNSGRRRERLKRAIANSGAGYVITSESQLAAMREGGAGTSPGDAVECVSIEALFAGGADDGHGPIVRCDPDGIALLQYTSGTSGVSRGVQITHANLVASLEAIRRAFNQSADSIIVGWLPLHHDMGLIGNVCEAVYAGAQSILMPPAALVRRPATWLGAIARYRATTSGGPSFAYELCVRSLTNDQRRQLDLASWDVAFNGSEPVRADVVDAFCRTFAECGFRKASMIPCYGLAEATLFVAGGGRRRDPSVLAVSAAALQGGRIALAGVGERSRSIVGVGPCATGVRVEIVNPVSRTRCNPDEIGEIWVQGPIVGRGYVSAADEDEQEPQFGGEITGEPGRFLRTGDLGFIRDGELFVTGRRKDMLIIRGRNHSPEDFEAAIQTHDLDLPVASTAAFGVESNGEERLVIVQEIVDSGRGDQCHASLVDRMRSRLQAEVDVAPAAIALVPERSVPRTTSGKVQRGACRRLFLDHALDVAHAWVAPDVPLAVRRAALGRLSPALVEDCLKRVVAARMRVPAARIGTDQPMSGLGLDSLAALEIVGRVEEQYAVEVPWELLLRDTTTIAQLASFVVGAAEDPDVTAAEANRGARGAADGGAFALSPAQAALWRESTRARDTDPYVISRAFEVQGQLDLAALRTSLRTLAARHASLRTAVSEVDGRPVQTVCDTVDLPIEEEELSGVPEEVFEQRLAAEAARRFDLHRAPLCRLRLFRWNGRSVLLFSIHHIITDLWSLSVLVRELVTLYGAARMGIEVALPPPRADVATVLAQQDARLRRREGELWSYWQQKLENPPARLRFIRPVSPTADRYEAKAVLFSLDADATRRLHTLAQDAASTPFLTLLSNFVVLLYRYSHQEDLLLGTLTNGRSRREWADVIGYMANVIPLRVRVSPRATFLEVVRSVKTTVLDALEHQDLPYQSLAQHFMSSGASARGGLLQTMFILQQAGVSPAVELGPLAIGMENATVDLAGTRLVSLRTPGLASHFDLTVSLVHSGPGMAGVFQYNPAALDDESVAGLCRAYQKLLENVLEKPHTAIADLSLAEPDDASRRPVRQPPVSPGRRLTLVERFEAVARHSPERIAVVCGTHCETYGSVLARTNAIARLLATRGVEAETPVGLLTGRTSALVPGILGILKAGGMYVPVDPTSPAERVQWTLRDAGAKLVLVLRGTYVALPPTVDVLEVPDTAFDPDACESRSAPDADQAAYVIYTSGSTGRPKGVVVSNGAVERLLDSTEQTFHFDASDTMTLLHSPAFDFSVWELWSALANGGRLVVVPEELGKAPHELYQLLLAERVTVLCQTPAAFHQLARAEELSTRACEPSLRAVIFGGDALNPATLREWIRRHGVDRPQLFNLYGITETTVHATVHRLTGAEIIDGGASIIGKPIPDLDIYVADPDLRPVPESAAGELCIAGPGLARGYRSRPDLTAERFVPDPFSGMPGRRLYRSGDIGKYRADGNLEYLGRADDQIKIRGFRVEPREVESVLTSHPDVESAVVIGYQGRLLGYAVARQGKVLETADLKLYLSRLVPDYMVPSSILIQAAFPMTANGKIDRRSLPLPAGERPDISTAYIEPATTIERQLSKIWADALGLRRVGSKDNFFELGGHSLSVVEVLNAVSDTFGQTISIPDFFEAPTIAAVASRIETRLQDPSLFPTEPDRVGDASEHPQPGLRNQSGRTAGFGS